jgi:3-oxoacyl-[acyl-carrier-protein] synthase-3
VLGADGARGQLLYAEQGERVIRMEGREVYRHAVRRMVDATAEALEREGLDVEDVDLFVAHQANARILEATAAELGLAREKVFVNVDRMANTSSASIPLALAQAEEQGRLRPGATVALAAFGAGFVWGAGIVSWKEPANGCT